MFQGNESFQGDLCPEVPQGERRNVSLKPDQLCQHSAQS